MGQGLPGLAGAQGLQGVPGEPRPGSLRFGVVEGNGSPWLGTGSSGGWIVSRITDGVYYVSFSAPMPAVPVVVASPYANGAGAYDAIVYNVSTAGFEVQTVYEGNQHFCGFLFIAVCK